MGLIVLPIVSFSADGLLSIVYFIRSHLFKQHAKPPPTLAEYRPIELSIQFILMWTPLVVFVAWVTHRPFTLLFDMFEVAILIGACFLVNYVTADSKSMSLAPVPFLNSPLLLQPTGQSEFNGWNFPAAFITVYPGVLCWLHCGLLSYASP